jgi:hypothetical protein
MMLGNNKMTGLTRLVVSAHDSEWLRIVRPPLPPSHAHAPVPPPRTRSPRPSSETREQRLRVAAHRTHTLPRTPTHTPSFPLHAVPPGSPHAPTALPCPICSAPLPPAMGGRLPGSLLPPTCLLQVMPAYLDPSSPPHLPIAGDARLPGSLLPPTCLLQVMPAYLGGDLSHLLDADGESKPIADEQVRSPSHLSFTPLLHTSPPHLSSTPLIRTFIHAATSHLYHAHLS